MLNVEQSCEKLLSFRYKEEKAAMNLLAWMCVKVVNLVKQKLLRCCEVIKSSSLPDV